jgi:hypothetical protein
MEGLDEAIYKEIAKALKAGINNLQESNKHSQAGFNEAQMDRLVSIADSYGKATIYCTYEFAATMIPSKDWVSEDHKNQMWNNGYLANYKGHNVIVLPQSFEDESNTKKVIDPSYAYIIPVGADKPVKIAFEGQTLVRELEQYDWSKHIDVYKKIGVGAVVTNNICVYQNTALTM